MTGFLHEREFSRRQFVKGGGALIVAFSLAGSGLAGRASAVGGEFASNGPFDQFSVDAWITINGDNTASVRTGGVFQGTGSETGLMMIAAEELDMGLDQMIFIHPDTDVTPETNNKGASNTIIGAGPGVRAAAATAKQALLGLASTKLGVPTSSLSVSNGVVTGGGKTVSYGQLLGGKLFNVEMPASDKMTATNPHNGFKGGLLPGQVPAKAASAYKLVGTSPPRIDVAEIVTGTATYIQNVHVPGMLHGRWVLPRGQGVYGFAAKLLSVDESSISHIPGTRIVRKGNFLGVVAPHEYDAIQAAAQLKANWAEPPAVLPGSGNEVEAFRALDAAGKTVQSYTDNEGNVDRALASAAHVVTQSYAWPTNSHAPIGPQCAIADVTSDGARILTWTQGVYWTREHVATLLGIPESKVRVTCFPGGGTYGETQFNEAAQAAALMSQLVGAPVRVQLMRWDEIGWDNNAPGTLFDIRAGIDSSGKIVGFDLTQFYPQYTDREVKTPQVLLGTAPLAGQVSGTGDSPDQYEIANTRFLLKSLPPQGIWVTGQWMREGSGPHSLFAIEQVIDELAHAAQMDPVAFRLQNTGEGPGRDSLLEALNAVTQAASWQAKPAASQLSSANIVRGRGFAWSGDASNANSVKTAAIADVSVNKKTGKITVEHVHQAFSAGLAIYPGGIQNQMVGGIVQITSRVLVEQLRYGKKNVESLDFVSYPILRFKDSPQVTPIVLQRSNATPQGVGEPVTLVAAAAIGNAFFDATGVRLRTAPLTPARVRAALKAANVA